MRYFSLLILNSHLIVLLCARSSFPATKVTLLHLQKKKCNLQRPRRRFKFEAALIQFHRQNNEKMADGRQDVVKKTPEVS